MIMRGEEATREYGRQLAAEARPGQVIALVGDLGAGKTTLTQYIAEGLGVTERVTSPTFTIVHEYLSGRLPLYHFDVYRLEDPEEMYDLGYEEYFFGDGLCVVEWADRVADLLPEDVLALRISPGATEDERIVAQHVGWRGDVNTPETPR